MQSRKLLPKDSELETLFRDTEYIKILITPKTVRLYSDKGIASTDRGLYINQTLEKLAQHINRRYREDYGDRK